MVCDIHADSHIIICTATYSYINVHTLHDTENLHIHVLIRSYCSYIHGDSEAKKANCGYRYLKGAGQYTLLMRDDELKTAAIRGLLACLALS